MIIRQIKCKRINLRKILAWLVVGCWLGGLIPMTPALAQGPGQILLEKPAREKKEEEKKEGAPTTCGPLISDTCLPIETYHASLQILWALSIYGGNFTPNWRKVSAKGDFYTFAMPVKFTYGPTKNMEVYVIAPFIHNWTSNLDRGIAGPNGERSASYSGVGDVTAIAKYNLLPETDYRPAITGVAGVGFPSGHASHLNPGRLLQDAVGTGAFTFTTGVNLFKYLKPFLVHSQIWLNTPVNLFPSRSDAVRSHQYVTFNLATEYPLNKRWVALFEVYSNWTWENIYTPLGFQSPTTVLGVLPGIEFLATDKWSVAAGAAIDLVGKFGSYKYTPMLTMYYTF